MHCLLFFSSFPFLSISHVPTHTYIRTPTHTHTLFTSDAISCEVGDRSVKGRFLSKQRIPLTRLCLLRLVWPQTNISCRTFPEHLWSSINLIWLVIFEEYCGIACSGCCTINKTDIYYFILFYISEYLIHQKDMWIWLIILHYPKICKYLIIY